MFPKLSFDTELDTFYVKLSDNRVYDTKKITSNIMIDIDEEGFLIGIESLSFGAEIPFQVFYSEYGVTREMIDAIKAVIKPIYRS